MMERSGVASASAIMLSSSSDVTPSSQQCHLRFYTAKELVRTEENYVNTLLTILKVYKEPLLCDISDNGPLLNPKQVWDIFGDITGILEVHTKIKDLLSEKISQWSETTSLGSVFEDKVIDKIATNYPPFVNYFELRIKKLNEYKRKYPLFHAFLTENESKCQRQDLEGMLITPIQRIPRIILLLQTLQKHTPEAHPDHACLNNAVEKMKETLRNINEDKRRVDNQILMFEVVKEINDCPAFLLSATRMFLRKVDVKLCSQNSRSIKSEQIVMFMFTDSIEIVKMKTRIKFGRIGLTYKHMEFIPLHQIRFLINFVSSDSELKMFGFVTSYPDKSQDRLLVFQLSHQKGDATKESLLTQLNGLISSTANNNSDEGPLVSVPVDFVYRNVHLSPVKSSMLHLPNIFVKRK